MAANGEDAARLAFALDYKQRLSTPRSSSMRERRQLLTRLL